jgi:hypothetical protein
MTYPRRYYFSCWQGKVGHELVNLAAGREANIVGMDQKGSQWTHEAECCQGVLRVTNIDAAGNLYRSELYSTPYKEGYVRIVSVSGSLITLAAYGDTSLKYKFVFDLATRKWVQPQANAVDTMVFGQQPCFADYNLGGPYLNDCWTGKVAGSIYNLESGVESRLPRDQGVLVVSEGADIDPFPKLAETYLTPLKVGSVSLTLVDKTYVYLQTADKSHTFVFDLKTRQWLTLPITPTPSMTPTRTSTPTPQLPNPPIGSTEGIQLERHDWQTAVASIPTFTPVPQSLQTPSILWKFERVDCGQDGSDRSPVSCWGGVGDGTILSVRTFRSTDDISRGSLSVCIGLYPCGLEATYASPLNLGTLHIVSISDNLVSLTPDDGQTTVTFDLQTRQWIPPYSAKTHPILTGQVSCPDYFGLGIDYFGCWEGLIGGETVQLRVGRESGRNGNALANAKLNCCKGVIEVGKYGTSASGKFGYYITSYTTMEQANALYIASVKGQRITLASYDPAFKGKIWILDLNERKLFDP